MTMEAGARYMTKTQHYRKVTKPLLERKRRARMNLYLDELKDLIVDTMEEQGEHVNKLEKADILELTVNYLKSQKHGVAGANETTTTTTTTPATVNFDKFRAGYTQAAYEVSHIFSTLPGLDLKFGTHLMKQLGHQLKDMKSLTVTTATTAATTTPPTTTTNATAPLALTSDAAVARRFAALESNKSVGAMDEDVWRPW